MKYFYLILLVLSLSACSISNQEIKDDERTDVIEATLAVSRQQSQEKHEEPEPLVPDFIPVKEGSSPLTTRTVSVAALNTPLRDVLYTIAETAHLNLVMNRGVDPALPVTMTFSDVLIGDALEIIFESVDYFYTVKDNILIVKAMDTEIFEIGQPNVTQEYNMNVGGDILSGTATSGEGDTGALSGNVSVTSASDKTSFQFWDAIESSLGKLIQTGTTGGRNEGAGFTVNRMTGTIMVTATKRDLNRVRDYISNLKKILNRQVVIEARIVEVQLSEALKYGIDWTAVGDWLGVGTTSFGTDVFTDVVTTAGPNFEFNITENDNIDLLLRALEEQGDVKTLSNPKVNIMNGQTAMLSVGRNTTFISRVETTTTISEGSAPVTTFTVDTNSILSGIMFGLVPYINSDNEITLTITPIVTNLVDLEAKLIGSGGNAVEIRLPTVDLREMSTTVKMMNGQLIVIGGLIDKEEKVEEDKVPVLGDIPVLGSVFKRVDKSYENSELVIMLIPRVII